MPYEPNTPSSDDWAPTPEPTPTSTPPRMPSPGTSDTGRLKRLLCLFALVAAIPIVPHVFGKIKYEMTAAEERARLEVAREHLGELRLDQLNTANRLLAQAIEPSVVSIRTNLGVRLGQGSGVIVDDEGYILTNYHVVAEVRSAEIELSDGRIGTASVIGVDSHLDLAVLKTELDELVAAPWGESADLQAGELVWALGSPFGLRKTITQGIVSATQRRGLQPAAYGRHVDPYDVAEFLQTDAAVNPGNSGGPLVNVAGEVIGINTAIMGEEFKGVSFAIPSDLARETYEAIRSNGDIIRGFLGVAPARVSMQRAEAFGLDEGEGVLVAGMDRNTPADQAGIELGDIILTWNEIAFSDPTLLSRAIAATPVGSEATVDIIRPTKQGPKRMTLQVTVGARPKILPRS